MASPSEISHWPLWVMLWCFENNQISYPEPSNDMCSQLLQTWLSLTQDEERCQMYQQTLFNAQLNTDRLLREWMWWLVFTEVDVLSATGLGVLSSHWDQSAYAASHDLSKNEDSQKYGKCLSRLLWHEFAPVQASTVALTKALQLERKECAIHAACMRVCRECFMDEITNDGSDAQKNKSMSSSHAKQTQWPASASSLINACPWLEFETSAYDLPKYLWDIQQRITVDVDEIRGDLDGYVAISHTWGRWKKTINGMTDFAVCAGARWPIPKNDRFDVSRLPDLLDQLKIQTRFVWLDLLCIPQDRSRLASIEIAKQAAIFRNAARCVCWLVDVDQWSGIHAAVQWLCAQYILHYDDGSWPTSLPISFPRDSPGICELVNASDTFYQQGQWAYDDINPWFTSLWTLQELCIRADMVLCNKDFAPLALGPASFPVTIADISALIQWTQCLAFADEEQIPLPVTQLYNLWAATGLNQLFKLSRATIMQLGTVRQCSGKHPEARAQAIMSAMGVVDWFLSFMEESTVDQGESLVLSTYPQPFVEELRRKAGSGSFFSDATMDFEMILKAFYFDNWVAHIRVVGSMLPFGPGKITNATDTSIFDTDEPCTQSWTLNLNGTVQMKRVFLQTSSEQHSVEPFVCTWFGPDATTSDYQPRFYTEAANLTDYLRQYKPHRRNYAVALTRSSMYVHGVLLKELSPKVLIRIGNYSWSDPSRNRKMVGEEVEVDWLVI